MNRLVVFGNRFDAIEYAKRQPSYGYFRQNDMTVLRHDGKDYLVVVTDLESCHRLAGLWFEDVVWETRVEPEVAQWIESRKRV